jgi:hypothetical protein
VPEQAHGLVADAEHPQRVTGRVVRHPVREGGADVLDPSTSTSSSESSYVRAATASPGWPARCLRRAARPRRAGGAPTPRTTPTGRRSPRTARTP